MNHTTDWQPKFCAGYLIPYGKQESEEDILSTLRGSIVQMNRALSDYFCPMIADFDGYPVEVVLESDDQHHPTQDLLRQIASGDPNKQEDASRRFAARLARVTDRRSDEGLLIILLASRSEMRRIALWKFPTDESIRAEFGAQGLSAELIQDAFSKESRYFKAAAFECKSESLDSSPHLCFWKGKVDDKQATSRITKVSDLWLEGFLQAKVELSDRTATRSVGKALRKTIDGAHDPHLQEQIIAVVISLRNQDGEVVTYREVARRLPVEVRARFLDAVEDPRIDVPFTLRSDVLESVTKLRIIILDNGFSVRGPTELFDIDQSPIWIRPHEENVIEISLRGRKVEDKLGVR